MKALFSANLLVAEPHGAAVITRNTADFAALDGFVTVVEG